jgi:hypothetical protein
VQKDCPVKGKLAEELFHDPREFLSVLKQDIKKMETTHKDVATKNDLSAFARSEAPTEKERAAAQIASDHLQQLHNMAAIPDGLDPKPKWNETISLDELNIISNLADGKHLHYILKSESINIAGVIVGATATAAEAALTVITFPSIFLAGAGAFSIVGTGFFTGVSAYKTFTDPSAIHARANSDHKMLESWNAFDAQR